MIPAAKAFCTRLTGAILALVVITLTISAAQSQGSPGLLFVSDFADDSAYMVVDLESGRIAEFARPPGTVRSITQGKVSDEVDLGALPVYDNNGNPSDYLLIWDALGVNGYDLYYLHPDGTQEMLLQRTGIPGKTNWSLDNRYLYVMTNRDDDGYVFDLVQIDTETNQTTLLLDNVYSYSNCNAEHPLCVILRSLYTNIPEGSPTVAYDAFLLNYATATLTPLVQDTSYPVGVRWLTNDLTLIVTPLDDMTQAMQLYDVQSEQQRFLADVAIVGLAETYIAPDGEWLMFNGEFPTAENLYNLYTMDLTSNPVTVQKIHGDFERIWFLEWLPTGHTMLLQGRRDDQLGLYAFDAATQAYQQLVNLGAYNPMSDHLVSPDNLWMVFSTENFREDPPVFHLYLVPINGDAAPREIEINTQNRICLLEWYEPGNTPRSCDMYFGIG